jgi:RNA polymerase sigma factor for flagellar operon FliA
MACETWRSSMSTAPVSEHALVLEHRYLARAIAQDTWNRLARRIDLDDLISAAMSGLADAARRFDPARRVSFRSYARHRILGAMLDACRAADWIPRRIRQRDNLVEQIRDRFAKQHARAATNADLRRAFDLDVDVDGMIPHELESLEGLQLAADGPPLDDTVARREMQAATASALEALPPRERTAIELVYFQDLSLSQAGEALHVTPSRACQLCGQGMRRLRERLVAYAT